MKKNFLTAVALLVGMSLFAQEKLATTVSGDFVSGYIWRGQDLGGVSLQPALGLAYKDLSLKAWGSVPLTDPTDTKEFDLAVSYTVGCLNIGFTDYWFSRGLDPGGRYFKYDAHGTNHVFEAGIGYDFGRVWLQWYTNFAGNDGLNRDGKRAYSSYVELNLPFRLHDAEWTATVGAVPYATDFYGADGFAVTNLALKAAKAVKVTDLFSIPVFAQLTANPRSQKAYLVFGFTLQP